MNKSNNVTQATESATIEKTEVLGWLLAYHTKSFDLKGRYLPHEVIGWLINDISTTLLFAEEGNT